MKRSYSRPAEFWRTFTLSLAAAGLVFALGWLLITRPTAEELPPPSSPLLPGTESRLTVLALGLSEEEELSLCALVSFQPDLIAIQVAALRRKPSGKPKWAAVRWLRPGSRAAPPICSRFSPNGWAFPFTAPSAKIGSSFPP